MISAKGKIKQGREMGIVGWDGEKGLPGKVMFKQMFVECEAVSNRDGRGHCSDLGITVPGS